MLDSFLCLFLCLVHLYSIWPLYIILLISYHCQCIITSSRFISTDKSIGLFKAIVNKEKKVMVTCLLSGFWGKGNWSKQINKQTKQTKHTWVEIEDNIYLTTRSRIPQTTKKKWNTFLVQNHHLCFHIQRMLAYKLIIFRSPVQHIRPFPLHNCCNVSPLMYAAKCTHLRQPPSYSMSIPYCLLWM